MKTIQFETTVKDIKTSEVKDDTCQMEGELEYNGREVKFKVGASALNKGVLEELFGGVDQTVIYTIVENAQQSLVE